MIHRFHQAAALLADFDHTLAAKGYDNRSLAIADILRNIDVAVSHDTVARFCREVLELTPRTRRPRKASAKALQHDSTGNPKANLVRKANTPQSDKGDRPDLRVFRPPSLGGPRIADPKTI